MDHGLMYGMLIAGIVLSAPPILLGVVVGVLALRHRRAGRPAARPRGME
jgi:hypothetical protein